LVAAASRTIFTQEAARRQGRQVADGLRARFARLARAMDEAKDDVLAYMTLHPDHWTRISSTNPLERLIGEIKRRTDVAGHLTDRGRDRPPGRRCCSKQNSLETLAAFGHSDQLRLSAVAA
jgi:putative transposase